METLKYYLATVRMIDTISFTFLATHTTLIVSLVSYYRYVYKTYSMAQVPLLRFNYLITIFITSSWMSDKFIFNLLWSPHIINIFILLINSIIIFLIYYLIII